ncbi:MAG: DUF2637 domain-containing protein [Streptosporangiaceae bacterium]
MSAADRAIRVSTAAAVLGVAGIAAYVSYWHAFEVVRAHGESGVTARLEPATIDGLVYSSSMVVLYAARHRLPVPGLARWLLALGIVATLAANVAHGWSHGPVGAAVAAWPAASLVGSYELLLWLIRTAAAGQAVRAPAAVHQAEPADHPPAELRPVSRPGTQGLPVHRNGSGDHLAVARRENPVMGHATQADRASEPDHKESDRANRAASQMTADWTIAAQAAAAEDGEDDIDAAAAAAYRSSIESGRPLSERKLAQMFGKTSRRWARNRMAEARQALKSAMAGGRVGDHWDLPGGGHQELP